MIVVNQSPIDQFTLVHAMGGLLARCMGISFQTTLALGFAWDYIIEPAMKNTHPEWFPYPSQDVPSHAFIDAITPAAAWLAYDAYLKRGSR